MKLLKTMVAMNDGLYTFDSVEIEPVADGDLWLIPKWLDNYPTKGFSKPEYMIRVFASKTTIGGCDYFLNDLLPKCVLDGTPTKEFEDQYEIRHLPDLFFDTPNVSNHHLQS